MAIVEQPPMPGRIDNSVPPPADLSIIGLRGVPEIEAGDNLVQVIAAALTATRYEIKDGDVLVVAQKIVSKAEGRSVLLDEVKPSSAAETLAEEVEKDPRLVELILSESSEVLRKRPGVLVVVHRLGIVLANAGIDASNVRDAGHQERVLLLPEDPDQSCAKLRAGIRERFGVDAAVVMNDSVGRAWRLGTVGIAIGVSGLPGLVDLRKRPDLYGRPLQVSETALADEVAAAASLVMGQADEACPIALVRGVPYDRREASARELLRPANLDLFR